MKRRKFISLVGGAVLIGPVAASAQAPDGRLRALHVRILRMQADAIAEKVDNLIKEIEGHLGWATGPLSTSGVELRRFDFLRMLRQVPKITEVSYIDPTGREQIKVSRLAMDKIGSETDYSQEPRFTQARANKVYVSPLYLRNVSKPYITLAIAGSDGSVTVAEVNLEVIQDIIVATRVGDHGVALVVDPRGRVIAHSDISMVQRDFSHLPHVQAAHKTGSIPPVLAVQDINSREILAAHANVARATLGVFVELPIDETTR